MKNLAFCLMVISLSALIISGCSRHIGKNGEISSNPTSMSEIESTNSVKQASETVKETVNSAKTSAINSSASSKGTSTVSNVIAASNIIYTQNEDVTININQIPCKLHNAATAVVIWKKSSTICDSFNSYFNDYTPPNYIQSSDPKHPLNYAIDMDLYYKWLSEQAAKYNINDTPPGVFSYPQIYNQAATNFYKSIIVLDQRMQEYLISSGKLPWTDAKRNEVIRKNDFKAEDRFYMRINSKVDTQTSEQAQIDLKAFLDNCCKNGFSQSEWTAFNEKYNNSDWEKSVNLDGHYPFFQMNSSAFTPGTYTMTEEPPNPYNYRSFNCVVTYNPYERILFTDGMIFNYLQPEYRQNIRQEIKAYKVEINVNKLLADYNEKDYLYFP